MNVKQLFTGLGIVEEEADRQADNLKVFLEKARDHFCPACEKFFKTIGATKNHIRLAHKEK